jgi:hypothetical protein
VRGQSDKPSLLVSLQFLHPMSRIVGSVSARETELGGGLAQSFQSLHELTIEGRLFQAGREAVEREFKTPPFPLNPLAPSRARFPFRFYASREFEPIRDYNQQIVGAILRCQEGLEGMMAIAAEPAGQNFFKITFRVENRTRMDDAEAKNHDAILLRTYFSTRSLLRAIGGEFASPTGHQEN